MIIIFFTSNNAKEVKLTMNNAAKLILEYCANNKLPANLQKQLYPNNVLK